MIDLLRSKYGYRSITRATDLNNDVRFKPKKDKLE